MDVQIPKLLQLRPDLISNEIIKYSSMVTCKAITKFFNLTLDSGKYPSNWRESHLLYSSINLEINWMLIIIGDPYKIVLLNYLVQP